MNKKININDVESFVRNEIEKRLKEINKNPEIFIYELNKDILKTINISYSPYINKKIETSLKDKIDELLEANKENIFTNYLIYGIINLIVYKNAEFRKTKNKIRFYSYLNEDNLSFNSYEEFKKKFKAILRLYNSTTMCIRLEFEKGFTFSHLLNLIGLGNIVNKEENLIFNQIVTLKFTFEAQIDKKEIF